MIDFILFLLACFFLPCIHIWLSDLELWQNKNNSDKKRRGERERENPILETRCRTLCGDGLLCMVVWLLKLGMVSGLGDIYMTMTLDSEKLSMWQQNDS